MSAESLNTCTLSGNLGNDAEVRYAAGGMAITSFSLAVNHRRKQQDIGMTNYRQPQQPQAQQPYQVQPQQAYVPDVYDEDIPF